MKKSTQKMNERLKGSLLVFIGACSFGILSTIVKTAYDYGYTLGEVTGSQTMLGMLILWLVYWVTKQLKKNKSQQKIHNSTHQTTSKNKTSSWKVMFAGIFTGLVGIFYYQCVKLIPASIAIILLMQNVWISMLIETVAFRKRPSRAQLFSAVIVLIGTVLAAGIMNDKVSLNGAGVIYGLLAAFSYSIFIITSGRVGNDLDVIHKSALMITGACAITFIIFPPAFLFNGLLFKGLIKWGLALAIFGTVIPPFLFSKGIPLTGVSLGAILGAAELPVAVLSSKFVLHEQVTVVQWIGVIIILTAIVIPNLPKRRNNHIIINRADSRF
ncbi:EamA family transporter [Porphyromonas pogonae]|uniref:EamA family transporter n=2 Tax=Porphyromonas pogonae TaxID=867595 RepID=UPI002E793017|nr:DMT family transporter [Porphyromonas pogonae]